jgi:chromosome segregation ATPase
MSVEKATRTATQSRISLPRSWGPSAVVEWLWKEIRRFRKESDEFRRKLGKSQRQHSDDKKQIADLEKEIAERDKKIAELEKILGQDHAHCGQPTSEVSFDHSPNARKLRRALVGIDFD